MNKAIIAAALAAMSVSAVANELTFSGEAGLVSNYVWRGWSQSNEDPAVQAGAELGFGNFAIGLWGSSVDFQDGDEATAEVDIYGSYTFDLTESFAVDVGGIYYWYPGADSDLDYDFYEGNVGATYAFSNGAEVGGRFSYSPEFFGDTGSAYHYEANGSIPVWKGLYVDANVGYSDLNESEGLEDYFNYGIGVGYAFKNADVRVGYSDTDINDADLADDQWVLSAKLTF